MKFALTNDDGIDAPGLQTLERVCSSLGSTVRIGSTEFVALAVPPNPLTVSVALVAGHVNHRSYAIHLPNGLEQIDATQNVRLERSPWLQVHR